MSTPSSNGDDADATERLSRREDSRATVESASPEVPHENGHVSDGAGDEPDSADLPERITELETLVDVLQAENERLRTDYARARTVSYRKTALALAAVGVVAVLGGMVFPDVRAVLFVTGATGLLGGVLTWYLTPARVMPVEVSESVYDAATTTLTEFRDELGLQATTVYVPVGERTRGFVPRERDFELPENATHVFPGDTSGSQGLTFTPAGQRLAREVEALRTTQTPATTIEVAEQVADALVEHFGVADRVAIKKGTNVREVIVSVDDPAFGPLTRLDHPIVSAVACAAAQGVEEPIVVDSVDEATVTLSVISEPEN